MVWYIIAWYMGGKLWSPFWVPQILVPYYTKDQSFDNNPYDIVWPSLLQYGRLHGVV